MGHPRYGSPDLSFRTRLLAVSIPPHDPVPRERSGGIAGMPRVGYIHLARPPIRVTATGVRLPSDDPGRGRVGGQADSLPYLAMPPMINVVQRTSNRLQAAERERCADPS